VHLWPPQPPLLNSSCGQEFLKESKKEVGFIWKGKINNTYLLVGPLWAPTQVPLRAPHMGMELQVSDLHSWQWDTNILNWWRAKINMMLCARSTFGPPPFVETLVELLLWSRIL
jgi:hypothetical protein